jgi:S-adenosylmethionine synthetase, N-terminal domain
MNVTIEWLHRPLFFTNGERKLSMIEKVNPMHADKIADRISGAIVDLAYSKSDRPTVAVEGIIRAQ